MTNRQMLEKVIREISKIAQDSPEKLDWLKSWQEVACYFLPHKPTYCVNCKFFIRIEMPLYPPFMSIPFASYNRRCGKVLKRIPKYSPYKEKFTIIYGSEYRDNACNNCRYYKRKWWKFWVKEIKR